MSDYRLMIVPCENEYIPCHSFVCDQPGQRKFYVGNPHSGGIYNYPVYCEHCIQHLVDHLPSDLSPSAASIENRLRSELTIEYEQVLAKKLTEATEQIRSDAEKLVAFKLADAENPFGIAPVENLIPIEENTEAIFRCLDCGEDFNNRTDHDEHKKEHTQPVPQKNKGGRPPKSNA